MTTFYTAREHFVHLRELVQEPAHWRAVNLQGSTPEQIVADFAANLLHLIGVPFRYLVPNNTMLPPESIRFFFVDQNWVEALIDGALSLGRIGDVDQAHDEALAPVIQQRAEAIALNRRRARLKQAKVAAPDARPVWGGFLLRSAVVSGWPGLEVQAFKSSEGSGVNTKCTGDSVELIRMERLANDVLICLFAEQFGCVNIHEPKEGINFGADPILPQGEPFAARGDRAEVMRDREHYREQVRKHFGRATVDPDKYTKQLRGLGINGYTIGDFIQGAVVDVPLRSTTTRVIQVDALRKAMYTKLTSLQPPAWTAPEADFTSAQFSLEMIEGASQHIFRAENSVAIAADERRRVALAQQHAADRKQLNAFLFGPDAEENA